MMLSLKYSFLSLEKKSISITRLKRCIPVKRYVKPTLPWKEKYLDYEIETKKRIVR